MIRKNFGFVSLSNTLLMIVIKYFYLFVVRNGIDHIFEIYFYLCYLSIKNHCDTHSYYNEKLALSTNDKLINITFSASSNDYRKSNCFEFISFVFEAVQQQQHDC